MFVFFEFFALFFKKLWITRRNTARITAQKAPHHAHWVIYVKSTRASSSMPAWDRNTRGIS